MVTAIVYRVSIYGSFNGELAVRISTGPLTEPYSGSGLLCGRFKSLQYGIREKSVVCGAASGDEVVGQLGDTVTIYPWEERQYDGRVTLCEVEVWGRDAAIAARQTGGSAVPVATPTAAVPAPVG